MRIPQRRQVTHGLTIRATSRHAITHAPSNPHKNLLPVHPQAHQPHDEQRGGGLDRRAARSLEQLRRPGNAQCFGSRNVNLQRPADPRLEQLGHAVHRNRIHPHDDERKGPRPPPAPIDHGDESRQDLGFSKLQPILIRFWSRKFWAKCL